MAGYVCIKKGPIKTKDHVNNKENKWQEYKVFLAQDFLFKQERPDWCLCVPAAHMNLILYSDIEPLLSKTKRKILSKYNNCIRCVTKEKVTLLLKLKQ